LKEEPFDLERFHAGDETLFTNLVRLYSPRLLPYLRRYAGGDIDVDDLLQEVWLRAYRKRDIFNYRGSFFGWLLTVSRTVGMASLNKRRRDRATDTQPEIPVADDLDTDLLSDEVREAILTLPERQRDVVMLRLIEGFSTAETAKLLGCAEGTVKATLYQVIRKLQALLKETIK
jgi:RNA polymerase sigma-70 factor, ECF subfamily